MPIITIDGNIGSGKSSVLYFLHKNYKIPIDLEPIENWKIYLDNFYNHKSDIFNFQLRVWLDRAWIQEKEEKVLLLMERSPYFIKNVFNKAAFENKLISDNEFNILKELYHKTDSIWNSNNYIYLRSNPEKCLERIDIRGRNNEKNITKEYLEQINNLHEIAYEEGVKNNLNILCIDIEEKTIEEIAKIIYDFIQK
jgi:deoxyadenosine/deoxycytidine kinase